MRPWFTRQRSRFVKMVLVLFVCSVWMGVRPAVWRSRADVHECRVCTTATSLAAMAVTLKC